MPKNIDGLDPLNEDKVDGQVSETENEDTERSLDDPDQDTSSNEEEEKIDDVDVDDIDDVDDNDDEDYLKRELKKTRREAGRYRTERNNVKATAEDLQKIVDEYKEEITTLKKEREELELNAVKERVSRETGVPVDLLIGTDEETLKEHASKLTEWTQEVTQGRGAPIVRSVGGKTAEKTQEDIARAFMLGVR